jgi:hypothetical protein
MRTMLRKGSARAFIVALAAAAAQAPPAVASEPGIAEILAEPPSNLIVTVYRNPYRGSGSIDLNWLGGFALVSETRLVHLPAGVSRVRFEGVADGIEPSSAIITGMPGEIIEKNRDARLLSPSTLIATAVGKPVELLRTNRKTGNTERLPGTILSDAENGVVFQSAQGIEALRCSGLPETFSFEPAADLSTRPTLSVEARSVRAMTTQVTLSYLSRAFDWAANYTATLSRDGKSIDLGAWVTLANSNGVGFPSAHTQVVAGRVNRENDEVEPIDMGGRILARCWARGSTSDMPMILSIDESRDRMFKRSVAAPQAAALLSVSAGAKTVEQEQLGDLKLYRVPERTTLASRQSKQVRLMDRLNVPVTTIYGADFAVQDPDPSGPAHRLLRSKNTAANHLGLPLPSGSVAVFSSRGDQNLLEHESDLRDIAVDEELEIDMGESPDVQVSVTREKSKDALRIEILNARPDGIQFELKLRLPDGAQTVSASHAVSTQNGRPIFRLEVPANQMLTLRYQWQRADTRILRTP